METSTDNRGQGIATFKKNKKNGKRKFNNNQIENNLNINTAQDLTGFGTNTKNNLNKNNQGNTKNNKNRPNSNNKKSPKKSDEAVIEQTSNTKSAQLDQIYLMYSDIIEKDIINDYWNMFNSDYDKTIEALSEMVEDIERQKIIDNEPVKPKEEEK